MTEQQLIKLGFNQEPIESYGEDYYYFYSLVGEMGLITCTLSEVIEGKWDVDVFDSYPTIRYYEYKDVLDLINAFKKGKIVR
jgi:hypothetical protein